MCAVWVLGISFPFGYLVVWVDLLTNPDEDMRYSSDEIVAPAVSPQASTALSLGLIMNNRPVRLH